MLKSEKYVSIYFDTMITDPHLITYSNIPITINIEHQMRLFSSNTIFCVNNIVQSINLDIQYEISNISLEYPALVSIYVFEMIVHQEFINLSRNVVGALKSCECFPLVFVFRVVNKASNEVVIHNIPRFNLCDFQITRCLGVGGYGKVFEAVDSRNESHALKILYKRVNIENKGDSTIREIIPLIALPRHPCMIKLEGFIFDSNDGLVLVLEHASRGRIDSLNINRLDNNKIYNMIYGLFSCVALIHEYKIIHRDIHPSNVLVTDNYEIRLIDFGSSRFIDNDMTRGVGHVGYISPDMEITGDYDELVDEYSICRLLKQFESDNPDFILAKVLIFILSGLTASIRVSCSEICTIIECDLFSSSSKENEEYFLALSEYHQSAPLQFAAMYICLMVDYYVYEKNYCDLIKSIDIFPDLIYSIFKDYVIYSDGVALDVKYLDPDNFQPETYLSRCLVFPLSLDKINIFYYLYIDGDDIKDIDFEELMDKFLIAFLLLERKDIYFDFEKIISHDEIRSLDEIIRILKNVNDISIKYSKPELLEAIILWLNTLKLSNIGKSLEYLAYNKNIMACELLALSFSKMYLENHVEIIQDAEKYRYYAEIAYRNGRFKAATALGIYHSIKNNTKESQKYFLIGAAYDEPMSMLYVGFHRGFVKGMSKERKWFHYLKKAADKGELNSQIIIAYMYFFGKIIPRNFEQAFYYNYLALNYKIPASYALYGLFKFFGIQTKQDFVQARLYFEKYIETRETSLCDDDYITRTVWICLTAIFVLSLGISVSIDDAKYYWNKLLDSSNDIDKSVFMLYDIYNIEGCFEKISIDNYFPIRNDAYKEIINFIYILVFEINEEEITNQELIKKHCEGIQKLLLNIVSKLSKEQ